MDFRLLIAALFLSITSSIYAETMTVRGARGVVLRSSSGRFAYAARMQGAPNLIFYRGGVFELDSSGRVNTLQLNPRTGQLVGAKELSTYQQLAKVLEMTRARFRGKGRQAVDAFLKRHQALLSAPKVSSTPKRTAPPPSSTLSPSAGPQRAALDKDRNEHGQGSAVTTQPQPNRVRAAGSRGTGSAPGACSDLNGAVCGASFANAERAAADKKRELVGRFIDLSRLGVPRFAQLMEGISTDPARFAGLYRAFTGFLNGELAGQVNAALGAARSHLLTALEKQPLSEGNKAAVRAQLARTKFRLSPDFTSLSSLQGFVSNCGPDGMAPGAFAITGRDEVVICPGLIVGGLAKGGSLESHLTHVLAHEMGHHCGADHNPVTNSFGRFKPLYARMEQCYREVHGGQGESRMGEIAADNWGVEALAVAVRGKSPRAAFDYLKNAMAPLCQTRASDVHPAGSFRLNVVLGRNPDIREALGCGPPTDERPACTLGGKEPDGL